MKITMVGVSDSGKTCFLHAMYYSLSGRGRSGFFLRAQHDISQELRSAFKRMLQDPAKRSYPEGNTIESFLTYEFDFLYGLTRRLQTFTWVDYRGGALQDKHNVKDRGQLLDHLLASDCVMLCVSGEHLKERVANDDALLDQIVDSVGIDVMNGLLADIANRRRLGRGNVFPVIIQITKFDRCDHRSQEELVSDIKALFPSLFLESDSGWHVFICPTTLGTGLGKDGMEGSVKPKYELWPITFAVHAVKRIAAARASAEATELSTQIKATENAGFLDWVFGPSSEEIEEWKRKEKLSLAELREIEEHMEILASAITSKEIYLNGKQVGMNGNA